MHFLSLSDIQGLMKKRESPCISLYLDLRSTSRTPGCKDMRLHSLLDTLSSKLLEACDQSTKDFLMQPLYGVAKALHEIPRDAEGLAMFRTFSTTGIFPTSLPVNDFTAISDSFHLKPILPMIQMQDSYYVVTLTQNKVNIFAGNHNSLKELKTYEFAERDDLSMRRLAIKSSRGAPRGKIGRYPIIRYQSPAKINKFFSECQSDISTTIQNNQGPIVTVGSAYLRKLFQTNNRLPNLLKEGINFRYNPGNLAILHSKALAIAQTYFNSRSMVLANQYLALVGRGRSSSDIAEIAESIFSGRVSHILISKDNALYGRLDRENGKVVRLKKSVDPIGDDVLCDLAQEVIIRGGNAHVLPQRTMPSPSPVAAIYRW